MRILYTCLALSKQTISLDISLLKVDNREKKHTIDNPTNIPCNINAPHYVTHDILHINYNIYYATYTHHIRHINYNIYYATYTHDILHINYNIYHATYTHHIRHINYNIYYATYTHHIRHINSHHYKYLHYQLIHTEIFT